MRSATPKVLHTLGGRSLLGHVLAAAEPLRRRRHRRRRRAPAATAVEEHLAEIAPGRRVPVVQERAARLRARRGRRAGRRPRPRRAGADRQRRRPAAARGDGGRAGRRAPSAPATCSPCSPPRSPTRPGSAGSSATPTARCAPSSRSGTPPPSSARSARSTPASTSATRPPCAAASAGSATDNDQGEQYLTDVLGLLVAEGAPGRRRARPRTPTTSWAATTSASWPPRRRTLNDRRRSSDLMRAGVTVVDPQTTWVDVDGRPSAPDAVLQPGTQLHGDDDGRRRRGRRPGHDAASTPTVGRGRVRRPVALPAAPRSAPDATVGPFSYLRPGHPAGPRGQGRAPSSR